MRTYLAAGLLACLLATGCNVAPVPIVVKGRVVRADGKPLTHMIVVFHPRDDQSKARLPQAVLDEKTGEFLVECLPGKYKVTLAPIHMRASGGPTSGDPGGATPPGTDTTGAGKYGDVESSPWEVTVSPGNSDEMVLTVK